MLVSRKIFPQLAKELKAQNKKLVFTNGCFDIIHSGHIKYLTTAKSLGDFLIVGLNTDASVKRLKGESRPINSEMDRAIVLSALKPIDFVLFFDEDTPKELIEEIAPDVLVKGGDYTIDTIVGADFVMKNGGEVKVINFVEGKSTTNIINKINSNNE